MNDTSIVQTQLILSATDTGFFPHAKWNSIEMKWHVRIVRVYNFCCCALTASWLIEPQNGAWCVHSIETEKKKKLRNERGKSIRYWSNNKFQYSSVHELFFSSSKNNNKMSIWKQRPRMTIFQIFFSFVRNMQQMAKTIVRIDQVRHCMPFHALKSTENDTHVMFRLQIVQSTLLFQ